MWNERQLDVHRQQVRKAWCFIQLVKQIWTITKRTYNSLQSVFLPQSEQLHMAAATEFQEIQASSSQQIIHKVWKLMQTLHQLQLVPKSYLSQLLENTKPIKQTVVPNASSHFFHQLFWWSQPFPINLLFEWCLAECWMGGGWALPHNFPVPFWSSTKTL